MIIWLVWAASGAFKTIQNVGRRRPRPFEMVLIPPGASGLSKCLIFINITKLQSAKPQSHRLPALDQGGQSATLCASIWSSLAHSATGGFQKYEHLLDTERAVCISVTRRRTPGDARTEDAAIANMTAVCLERHHGRKKGYGRCAGSPHRGLFVTSTDAPSRWTPKISHVPGCFAVQSRNSGCI